MDIITTKDCSRCHQSKPLAQYSKNKSNFDGLAYYCRECQSAYYKEWRKDKVAKLTEYQRKWQRENRVHIRAYRRRYYHDNIDKERAARQRHFKTYRTKHPERIKLTGRNYRLANPESDRVSHARRKARKLAVGGNYTKEDVRLLYRSQHGKCWWCSKAVGDDYHIDHRIPLSRGGSNAPENLCISCPSCNMSKGAKLPQEWNGRLL